MAQPKFNPPPGPFRAPERVAVASGPKLIKTGTQIISGFIEAGTLAPNNYVIPSFDPRTKKGYQRPPQQTRINDLANDLKKGRVDLPTSILLNVRGREARSALKDGFLDLTRLRDAKGKYAFYVVDGQHRIKALEKLILEEEADVWSKYQMAFVCMLGADEREDRRWNS